jgi:hypothetical protein
MAGGKFLINCLALSPDAVLQDKDYAQQDLDGNLSSADKMQILRDRISKVKRKWNDLMMGCKQLSGAGTNQYREYSDDLSIFTFNHVMELLSNSNKLFFIVAHDPDELRCILKIWPNARVVVFVNCLAFIGNRGGRYDISVYWEDIRGSSWPIEAPKTYNELMELPQRVVEEIDRSFPTLYDKLIDSIERYPHDLAKTIFWDNDLYFSAEKTVDGVEKLYQIFNLSGFNREYILEYHELWINKLNELK